MRRLILAAAALTLLVGCSGSDRGQVVGQILRQDGTPVIAARDTARSDKTGKWATSSTDAEGRFALGTAENEEGIPPGDYYVIIVEDRGGMENPRPATIHEKYASPGSSGLTVSVAAGQTAELNVKLDPPS
jgi:hypothetical protein